MLKNDYNVQLDVGRLNQVKQLIMPIFQHIFISSCRWTGLHLSMTQRDEEALWKICCHFSILSGPFL